MQRATARTWQAGRRPYVELHIRPRSSSPRRFHDWPLTDLHESPSNAFSPTLPMPVPDRFSSDRGDPYFHCLSGQVWAFTLKRFWV